MAAPRISPDIVPTPSGAPLPDPDGAALAELQAALARYRSRRGAAALEPGLAAARRLLAETPGAGSLDAPGLRAFAEVCPAFAELITAAADEAGQAVATGHAELWTRLGLRGDPPVWTPAERDAARMVFARACSPVAVPDPGWVPTGLRRLSAARLGRRLTVELAGAEAVWLKALGGRYGSLRHRCAPRTTFRSRGLADLLRDDESCPAAVAPPRGRWAPPRGAIA